MFIIIILLYLLIGVIEIVPLFKNRKYKELWLYSTTITLSLIVSVLLSIGVKIPSPAKPIEQIVLTLLGK